MKKTILFLFVAALLTACSSGSTAPETVTVDSTKVVVNDSAAKTVDCKIDSVLAKDSTKIK